MAGVFTHNGNIVEGLPSNASMINYNNTSSGMLATQVQDAVDELHANKQPKTDNNLTTTNKTITGGINELKSGLTDLDSEVNGDATTYPYADVITIEDAVPSNLADCSVKIEPVQDLHGYDKPWVGGANVNLLPSLVPGTYEKDGIIVTVDNNGNMNISGTKTASSAVTINVPLTSQIDISANYYLHIRNDVSDSNVVTMGITFSGTNRIAVMNDMQGVQNCVVYIASVATLNINARLSIEKTNNVTDWSPYENICPITGHTEASVKTEGKNQCPVAKMNTLNSDTFKLNAGTYTISFKMAGMGMYSTSSVILRDDSNADVLSVGVATASSGTVKKGQFTLQSEKTLHLYVNNITASTGGYYIEDIQIELGQNDTPYVPYTGKTYTISLGDTIYGGTVNFDSGVMTVTHKYVDMGTLGWFKDSTNVFKATLSDGKYGVNLICSQYYATTNVNVDGTIFFNNAYYGDNKMAVCDSRYAEDAAETFATAMNGVQLVYELATPTTIQLTPTQIQLLKGQNTLYASTGQISVTVNGVSGSIGAVQEQVNDYEERIETVESGLTAIETANNLDIIQVAGTGTDGRYYKFTFTNPFTGNRKFFVIIRGGQSVNPTMSPVMYKTNNTDSVSLATDDTNITSEIVNGKLEITVDCGTSAWAVPIMLVKRDMYNLWTS